MKHVQAGQLEVIRRLADMLCARNWMLATAESCTGGALGGYLTDVAGASRWYAGGVISYTNQVKQSVLGVDKNLVATQGAVSEAVARAMAEGVRRQLGADISVSITGIAGPDGGSRDKKVGTVWFGWSVRSSGASDHVGALLRVFGGTRKEVRTQAVRHAVDELIRLLSDQP